jgi:hypothetical protein
VVAPRYGGKPNGAAYEFRNALIGISEICAEPISAFNAETICHEKSHCNGSDLFSGVTTMLRRAMIALLAIVLIGLSHAAVLAALAVEAGTAVAGEDRLSVRWAWDSV